MAGGRDGAMNGSTDPFVHHPELRGQIADPDTSFLRRTSLDALAERLKAEGLSVDWWYSDEAREALRHRAMADLGDADLWVFGYGSLMWDPGFHFSEVRRAHVASHARRFILKDVHGGRGTADAPGLMAALDTGPGCDGLVFRIAPDHLDAETAVLWRREQIGPAYVATFVDAVTGHGPVRALTFVANHASPIIDAGLAWDQQVEYAATGTGFLGTSLDYLKNVEHKLAVLGIEDADVTALRRAAEDHARRT